MRMHMLVCVPVCATCVPLVCVCVRERGVSAPANTLVSGTFASATLAAHALRPVHELPGSASLRPATEPWGWAPRAADRRCGDASQGPEKMPVPHLSSRPPQSRASSLPRGEMSRRRHRALLSSGTGQWSSPDPPAVTAETRPGHGSRHLRPAELLWGQEHTARGCGGQDAEGPSSQRPEPTAPRPAGAAGRLARDAGRTSGAACSCPARGLGLASPSHDGRGKEARTPAPTSPRGSGHSPGSLRTGHPTLARGTYTRRDFSHHCGALGQKNGTLENESAQGADVRG